MSDDTSQPDGTPAYVRVVIDPVRLDRLRRHILRLARRQPGTAEHPYLADLWAACASAAAAGFIHASTACKGSGPNGECASCKTVNAAHEFGFRAGMEMHDDLHAAAEAQRSGRVN